MNQKIYTLANRIRSGKEFGENFVLMLGAGASLAAGVKKTPQIMAELLDTYGTAIEGADLRTRFNELWKSFSEQEKNNYLSPFLNRPPTPGYANLATLIRKGYFDTIITFNFDRLLETALDAAGLRQDADYKVIIFGDHSAEKVVELMALRTPTIKILKLHGSLTGTTFLWSEREMLTYPPPVENLVKELTQRPIIVAGYGFDDLCVQRAFAVEGEAVYCVNPSGPPNIGFAGVMGNRRSDGLAIRDEDGKFDSFFGQLDTALTDTKPGPTNVVNPFKYLESYEAADAKSFFGRDQTVADLMAKVNEKSYPLICVMGPAKSGKTSLVRAGVVGQLNEQNYEPVYLRCRGTFDQTLTSLAKWDPGGGAGQTGMDLLAKLTTRASPRHVVLVLDQFERVFTGQPKASGEEAVRKLVDAKYPNLTIVCVCTEHIDAMAALLPLARNFEFLKLDNIAPAQIVEIIQRLAGNAGVTFAAKILEGLQEEYSRGINSDQNRFTLAHVQAICHVLCEQGPSDLELYRTWIRNNLATLDLAINHCDIINFIEDVPNVDERGLLRDIIRLVSHQECNQVIVNYVRTHVSGMWK